LRYGTHRCQDAASDALLDGRTTGKQRRIQRKATARLPHVPSEHELRLTPGATQLTPPAKGSRCPISSRTTRDPAWQIFCQKIPPYFACYPLQSRNFPILLLDSGAEPDIVALIYIAVTRPPSPPRLKLSQCKNLFPLPQARLSPESHRPKSPLRKEP